MEEENWADPTHGIMADKDEYKDEYILYDDLLDASSHRWHTTIGFYKFWIHSYPIVDS